MLKSKTIVVAVVAVWLTIPLAAARAKDRNGTSISRASNGGRVLTLSTGTRGGECTAHGTRLACYDGASLAIGDAELGCERVEGGGRCSILAPEGPEPAPEPRPPATTESSTIDVECETGSKRGSIYTLNDGDGRGSCGPNKDEGGRVNGGTCTKNGSECGSVDCDHGCGASSSNCECRVKTSVKKVQQTE